MTEGTAVDDKGGTGATLELDGSGTIELETTKGGSGEGSSAGELGLAGASPGGTGGNSSNLSTAVGEGSAGGENPPGTGEAPYHIGGAEVHVSTSDGLGMSVGDAGADGDALGPIGGGERGGSTIGDDEGTGGSEDAITSGTEEEDTGSTDDEGAGSTDDEGAGSAEDDAGAGTIVEVGCGTYTDVGCGAGVDAGGTMVGGAELYGSTIDEEMVGT